MTPDPYHSDLDQRLRNAELLMLLEHHAHAQGIAPPVAKRTHIFNTNPAPQAPTKEKMK